MARFLNYLLVPLHTSKAVFSPDQYGVISEMYSYVGFLMILLTYGMETAFFRLSNSHSNDKRVFSTLSTAVIISSSAFMVLAFFCAQPIAGLIKYPEHPEFVKWFALIVGFDAICSLSLAKLRKDDKAWNFVGVNLLNVAINIGLNLYFLAYCLPLYKSGSLSGFSANIFSFTNIVSYVFIANLVASSVKLISLLSIILKAGFGFDTQVFKKAVIYAFPLLIAGLAAMVNENLDKILLRHLLYDTLGESQSSAQVGIYGACYKISIIITLFIQAFRYAAEPFFFAQSKQKNAKETYAKVMHYFVIVCSFLFLFINLFLHYIKYFIPNQAYWEGLKIVPILLMANIFLGMYYNLAIWFKLTDKTKYSAYMAIFGACITVFINVLFIPKYGYMASSWATVFCYGSMALLSYFLGQKHYKVPYNVKAIFSYLLISFILFYGGMSLQQSSNYPTLIALFFCVFFGGIIIAREKVTGFKKT